MIKNKIRTIGALLLCAMMANVIIPANAKADTGNDWVVGTDESYSNQVIILDGNLIIQDGGNLILVS